MKYDKKGNIMQSKLVLIIITAIVVILVTANIGKTEELISPDKGLSPIFQIENEITGNNEHKNIKTLSKEEIEEELEKKFFKEHLTLIKKEAEQRKIEPEILIALILQENGYDKDFKKNIRFECHKFNQIVQKEKKVECTCNNKNYCTKDTGKEVFSRVSAETSYDAYKKAKEINAKAAFESTSSGFGQMMGNNYIKCGYGTGEKPDIKEVEDINIQIKCFFNFLDNNDITKSMSKKKWKDIAEKYNGEDYEKNNYDIHLEKNYLTLKEIKIS